jgi:hypothetical protein
MSSLARHMRCDQADLTSAYVLGAVPADEVQALQAHLASCSECRDWLTSLRPVIDSFAFWPNDILRPSETLRARLAARIAANAETTPSLASSPRWIEPDWEQVAPGISCKLLATDSERHRVSMLVCLAPGVEYPPHTHAGREELHLLDGELWIDNKKLYPGDYNRAEAGTADKRVWSETGCTCVLVTSTQDVLG